MRALLTNIAGDLRKRRLQAVVVVIVAALAAGVGALALEILDASSAPYQRAFEQNAGAHLDVQFDGRKVSEAQLGATTQLPDVTAAAGPWPLTLIPFEYGTAKTPLYVIGRADPGGSLDRLQLVAGRWAQQPGEIVLTRSFAQLAHLAPGDHLTALSKLDKPQLTVVGEVVDIEEADASNMSPQFSWVVPQQVTRLLAADGHADYQMLYRFRHAATDAELAQDTQEIASALPPGAIASSLSHLLIANLFNLTTTLTLTFLLAFSVFALVAAALIVANMVAGAVLASYHEIGIVKALGFTPGQVVLTFTGQMLVPALAGCIVGASLGFLGSISILRSSAEALALPPTSLVSAVPAVIAALGVLAVVCVVAGLAALRGGLLPPVLALTQGVAPAPHRRSYLSNGLQRLGLPRIVSLGAGDAFARPLRGLLTTLAVLIGVATLTFAYGLHTSIQRLGSSPAFNPDTLVTRFGSYPDTLVTQALQQEPDTASVVAYTFASVEAQGLSNPVAAIPMRGNSAQLGFQLLEGRWFSGPGEAVGGSAFVREARLKVGDTFTVMANGRVTSLRLVGVYFDTDDFGRVMRFDWTSYQQIAPDAEPLEYQVTLRSGADPQAYAARVLASAPDFLSVQARSSVLSPVLSTLDAVLAVLVAVLAAIAVAGVFNTVLLGARERIRDTATLKTLGMTPAQVIGMMIASACILGAVGGILGAPVGVWLHQTLLALMGNVVNDPAPPGLFEGVFNPAILALLALAGIVVGAIGAALPAWMASRQPVAETLRAE